MALDAVKAAALLFVAAIVQVTIVASVDVLGGTPDLLLVTLVAVALLRGSVVGAVGGFVAGLLLDTAHLETLGLTSLVLTLVGYWVGRYGETTGRGTRAPLLSVGLATVVSVLAGLALHFVLGQATLSRLAFDALLPTVALNLILGLPVFAVARRLLRPFERAERSGQVSLLG